MDPSAAANHNALKSRLFHHTFMKGMKKASVHEKDLEVDPSVAASRNALKFRLFHHTIMRHEDLCGWITQWLQSTTH